MDTPPEPCCLTGHLRRSESLTVSSLAPEEEHSPGRRAPTLAKIRPAAY
jgi:hypothetical protein